MFTVYVHLHKLYYSLFTAQIVIFSNFNNFNFIPLYTTVIT